MTRITRLVILAIALYLAGKGAAAFNLEGKQENWSQWRGPNRDGQVNGAAWPDRLTDNYLEQTWRVPLSPSYSGPIVSDEAVFVTETKDKSTEIVRALSRATGKELWKVEWPGAISVPFFAKRNGDWIRATPAYDGKSLYVAGMRDVLVSLDAKSGKENWRVDFTKEFSTAPPEFGLVCSPLLDGNFIYIQAGNAVVKLDKRNGKVLWRALNNEQASIMTNGAFSSPVMATVAGQKQLIVQTREQLAGVDPETGKQLWIHTVPSFRGMNILTPVVFGDAIFTSSYQNKSWLYRINKGATGFTVNQAWENNAQGYMSTPVVIDGYAYLHLGNQRFTCINLQTGERTWTSQPFGKYASLVAQRDRILALDERGILLLIKANPKQFELLSEKQVSDEETWAHLAIAGEELFIRELNAVTAWRWRTPKKQVAAN
ncbi:MAG: PQQ-binding-like beta-propeller repeat protein [Acidobacteria bacterium]|nr:PQQ-binding-like beta-propeller repeat protein [Acidobacteriota bacterium]